MKSVLVVGNGPIGKEYVKALLMLKGLKIDILTKTLSSSVAARQTPNIQSTFDGGTDKLREIAPKYDFIIIAVPVESLLESLTAIASNDNIKAEILVEKPISLDSTSLEVFQREHSDLKIYGALNRLFFPSILRLKQLLKDEIVLSGRFCFTEWIHTIPFEQFPEQVLQKWGAANSIHLVSTFFSLMGLPADMNCIQSGKLDWHSSGARFFGSGNTVNGFPFAYDADWESSGRHHIEIFTKSGTYRLCPLQQLSFIEKGKTEEKIIEAFYSGPTKCGFKEMVENFITGNTEMIQSLEARHIIEHLKIIEKIFDYPNT